MLVDEWVETVWTVLNVRTKTLKDYKHLYKGFLKPVIGSLWFNSAMKLRKQKQVTQNLNFEEPFDFRLLK